MGRSKLLLWLAKVMSIAQVALQDGVPIHGPYGRDGRLVDVSELDECNGRWDMNANGEKDGKGLQTGLPLRKFSCFHHIRKRHFYFSLCIHAMMGEFSFPGRKPSRKGVDQQSARVMTGISLRVVRRRAFPPSVLPIATCAGGQGQDGF